MTPRQRFPEIWAATFGAAWMAYQGGVTLTPKARAEQDANRAEYAAGQADRAAQAWSDLLDKRCNEPADPPHA